MKPVIKPGDLVTCSLYYYKPELVFQVVSQDGWFARCVVVAGEPPAWWTNRENPYLYLPELKVIAPLDAVVAATK